MANSRYHVGCGCRLIEYYLSLKFMAEMYKEFSYLQIPRSTQCLKLALHIFSWETIRINQKKIFEYVFKLIISIYSFIYYQIFIKEMNITMCFSPSAFKTLIDNAQSWLKYEEMSVVEVTPFPLTIQEITTRNLLYV